MFVSVTSRGRAAYALSTGSIPSRPGFTPRPRHPDVAWGNVKSVVFVAVAKRKAARPTKAKFYWANPPGRRVRGSLVRTLGGRMYARDVGPNDLLDIHEAAAALGNLHVYSVYRLIWERRLPVVRQGRSVLIRLREVARYRKTTPRSPAVKSRSSLWFAG